jgi:glycosyltransferase involved in cell wall biosynthesis
VAEADLVLFTGGFPYDGHESVLRSEVAVTAPRFRRLFVIPSRRGTYTVPLPENVSIVDLGWDDGWDRAAKLRALVSPSARHVAATTLKNRSDWSSYLRGARSYLDILATNLLKAHDLRAWIAAESLRDAIFYDYWFENTTLALAVLRAEAVVRCAVSRAHRFDIFDASWEDLGRVPFRDYKARYLDAVFAVSEDGARYLRDHVDGYASKVSVARLGIPLPPDPPAGAADPPLIVSCSALLPRKRVHLIPRVLAGCGRPLHWIHFGDGPERECVQAAAAGLPPGVTWELRGWVDNQVVREFYSQQAVSVFLSLSSSEGIPVSMMEAQSFGIPVVAIAAGGISELVTPRTGVLLDPRASEAAVGEALQTALQPEAFSASQIRAEFSERYGAQAAYDSFAGRLLEIWRRSDGGH